MTLEGLLGGLGAILLVAGCVLATIGLYGLILKPDLFEQLHVAGLVTGPGVVLVLLASIGTGRAEIVTSAILVIAFVLVTSSISTHVIAHAGVRRYGSVPGGAVARQPGEVAPATPVTPGVVTGGSDRARALSHAMRVVMAYDDSAGARLASDLAAVIDWPAGTIIRLIAAADADAIQPLDGSTALGPDARGDGSDRHRMAIEVAARALRRDDILVETSLVRGDAADVVIEETVAFGADLLITGSRRRGFVQALLGVSASGDIVDRAPCPVLVARRAALGSVMLTTDGSPQSAAGTEIVGRWSIFDLTPVRVVTVAAEPGPADQRTADLAAASLMDAGRDVVVEVLVGRPATRIVETARDRSVDLIVIGSRGRTGLGRTLLGSVAGEVLAAADCSVLIVNPPLRRPIPGS